MSSPQVTIACSAFTAVLCIVLCLGLQIITLYSGKTVEVNNTDAEGRLVLGDGVAYAAKHLSPTVILDMATLTGAQGISTGLKHGAIYCNNESLEATVVAAGKTSGNLVFPVRVWWLID